MRGHIVGHHQPHHAAEAPLPHAFLDGLEQIVGFQFLDGDIGVARDMEGMRFDHLHAGKQRRQVGRDHLLQPDASFLARLAVLAALLARPFQRNQLRQRIRHLHAREVLLAVSVADQHRQVQAQIGDMRKRAAGIEGQRRQHRKHRLAEIRIGDCQLLLVQRGVIQDLHAGFGQRREQLVVQALVGVVEQLLDLAADGHQLGSRMHAVGPHIQDAGVHLGDQAGHAHHEKLVQVGADNGQELDALQQRIPFVLSLLQYAALEGEQAQLAVKVELRRIQRRDFGGRRGLLRRRCAGFLGCHALRRGHVCPV